MHRSTVIMSALVLISLLSFAHGRSNIEDDSLRILNRRSEEGHTNQTESNNTLSSVSQERAPFLYPSEGKGYAEEIAKNGNYASPAILQSGIFFYIGISISTLLWFTGHIIETKLERLEVYAERSANNV